MGKTVAPVPDVNKVQTNFPSLFTKFSIGLSGCEVKRDIKDVENKILSFKNLMHWSDNLSAVDTDL